MCNYCDDDYHDSRIKALEEAAWKDWDEVPYRKAGKSKGKKRSDHKHIMAQEKVEFIRSDWGLRVHTYRVVYYNCIICMDRQQRTYDWKWSR